METYMFEKMTCEEAAHTFTLEIWVERTEKPQPQERWRGRVTDLLTGESRDIDDLQEVCDFLTASIA